MDGKGFLLPIKQRISKVLKAIAEELTKEDLMRLRLHLTEHFSAEDLEALDSPDMLLQICKRKGYQETILLLNRRLSEVVQDITENVKEELQDLSKLFTDPLHHFGLSPKDGNNLFGRTTELQKLLELIQKKQEVKVINVCGLPGIGKTHLVCHLGLQLLKDCDYCVLYVNLRGHPTLTGAYTTILRKLGVEQTSTEENLKSLIVEKLIGGGEGLILILDDLASLMVTPEAAYGILEFIQSLVKKEVKAKIVLTSRRVIKYQEETDKRNRDLMYEMRDYVENLHLAPLSDYDAEKFLNESIEELSQEKKDQLIKKCHGHPECLNLLKETLTKYENTPAGLSGITASNLESLSVVELSQKLFGLLFDVLSENQKLFLLAVAMFNAGAPFLALYKVIKPPIESKASLQQISKELSKGFLITIVQSQTVQTQHPLVDEYLKQISTGAKYAPNINKIKMRFQEYFIGVVIEIGRQYLENPKRGMELMVDHLRNIERAFEMISADIDDFSIESLFGKLENSQNIMFLFVCSHYHPELFAGSFKELIEKIINRDGIKDRRYYTLLSILQALLLAVDNNWMQLQHVIRRINEDDLNLISSYPSLHQFCLAICYHVESLFYTHSPAFMDEVDHEHSMKRESLYKKSEELFEELKKDDSFNKIADYFLVYILVNKAEAIFNTGVKDREVIARAAAECSRAVEYARNASILICFAKGMHATYMSIQGDKSQGEEAIQLLNNSIKIFEESLNEYKIYQMHVFSEAACIRHSYAVAIRSKAIKMDDQYNETRLKLLKDSLKQFTQATWTLAHCKNKTAYFKTCFIRAQCLENLAAYSPAEDNENREFYARKALKNYKKTFDLVVNDYRSCNITPEDWAFLELKERLPLLMELAGENEADIEMVIVKLNTVQQNCSKELELTRSSCYNHFNKTDHLSDYQETSDSSTGSRSSHRRTYDDLCPDTTSSKEDECGPPKQAKAF